jgi:hypothetical protein
MDVAQEPLKTVEAVDATESIINNSDGCRKATTTNHRNPSRDSSRDSLAQKAGVATIEAYDELVSKFALKKQWLKYKHLLGEYPKHYKGLQKCHLRALYSVFPKAAKLAHSKKIKHHQASEIQECLQLFEDLFGRKVFHLCGTHLVSICPSFFTDNTYCWHVTNFEIACEALAKLLASQYFTNALRKVLGVNVILYHWIP